MQPAGVADASRWSDAARWSVWNHSRLMQAAGVAGHNVDISAPNCNLELHENNPRRKQRPPVSLPFSAIAASHHPPTPKQHPPKKHLTVTVEALWKHAIGRINTNERQFALALSQADRALAKFGLLVLSVASVSTTSQGHRMGRNMRILIGMI